MQEELLLLLEAVVSGSSSDLLCRPIDEAAAHLEEMTSHGRVEVAACGKPEEVRPGQFIRKYLRQCFLAFVIAQIEHSRISHDALDRRKSNRRPIWDHDVIVQIFANCSSRMGFWQPFLRASKHPLVRVEWVGESDLVRVLNTTKKLDVLNRVAVSG